MPATHLVHPLMWLPCVRKNTNYAALRYPVFHTLHICLSQMPYNLCLLNLACVYPNSGLQLHTTYVHESFCHSMAILRLLLAYHQRCDAHQLLCKVTFDLLTAVTRGFKNSASLLNGPRRFEGSYDTHTHTHTQGHSVMVQKASVLRLQAIAAFLQQKTVKCWHCDNYQL